MENKELPKISIVTPSYNYGELIEQTLLSIKNQQYPYKEHIVIDGGSTDGTVQILQNFDRELFYWISEPDNGQSEALLKGFTVATGDILYWLNAGDCLEPNALSFVGNFFKNHPEIDWLISNDIVEIDHWSYPNVRQTKVSLKRLLAGQILYQDGIFFRQTLYRSVQGVNPNLWGGMDYDLWLQFLLKTNNHCVISEYTLSRFLIHANQKSSDTNRYNQEVSQIRSARTTIKPDPISWLQVNTEKNLTRIAKKLYELNIPTTRLLLHYSLANSWYFHSSSLPKFHRVSAGKQHIACPLCHGQSFDLKLSIHDNRFHQPGIYEIVWCPNCNIGLTRPQLDLAELTKLYEQFYSDQKIHATTPENVTKQEDTFKFLNPLKEKVKNFTSSKLFIPYQYSGKLLDFGCNDGRDMETYRQLGRFTVFGLDINPSAVEIARGKGFNVHCGSITNSPWEDNFFDVIVLSQVIEHLANPLETLLQLRQKLKANGHIILTLPNATSLWAKLFHMAWAHWHVPYHLYHYTPQSISLLAKRSQLTITKISSKSPSYWLFLSLYLQRNYSQNNYEHLSVYPIPSIIEKIQAVFLQLFSALFLDRAMQGDMITVILKRSQSD